MLNKEKKIKLSDVFTDVFLGDLAYTFIKGISTLVIVMVIIGLIFFNFIFSVSIGPSMDPSVPNNSIVISKKVGPRSKLKPEDIVIFKSPDGFDIYIKRIVGLPGDVVDIANEMVHLNGKEIEENYQMGITTRGLEEFSQSYRIENDSYYVLGDNRENSVDSREFGGIKREKIMGKIVFVLTIGK